MNISALLFILLALWIFTLQSKIKHLENLVYGPKNKKRSSTIAKDEDSSTEEKEIIEKKVFTEAFDTTVNVKVEDSLSSVETFKQSDNKLAPQEPSKIVTFIREYFTGGNLLVRIGGIILFFGLAFLVKYAAEHSIISMQMRLWGIALTAVILMILGWRLRDRDDAYGQILQGLGIAMLYLVIYGAAKFYAMLSLDVAFMLMLGVVLLGSVLAVIEDSLPLALFATAGGFLVPILTSSGQGSHIVLFSYYAFLNVGVFIVAWYRSWRVLNVVGFLFTFVIAAAWGVLHYGAQHFESTEPFLVLYFVMYLGISILFTLKHPFKPKNFVDSTLVFGLPVVAFPLQLHLVRDMAYGDATSAVILGVVYLGLWTWLRGKERTGLLAQSFLALSVVFFTIAIPYIFDADVSAALWSLEGTAAIWVALKQERMLTRYFGALLLTVSIFVYPATVNYYGITVAEYLGYFIVIIASFLAAYLLDTHKQRLPIFDAIFAKFLLGVGITFWFVTAEILSSWYQFYDAQEIFFTLIVGASLLFIVTKRVPWKLLVDTLQGTLPLGLFIFLAQANERLLDVHPFAHLGALLFAALFVLHFLMLHTYQKKWRFDKHLHLLGLWFMVLVASLEVHYHTLGLGGDKIFEFIALALVPLLVSIALLIPKQYKGWLESSRNTYQLFGVGVLIFVLFLWEIGTFMLVTKNVTYLDYLPLFNLLDMMQVLVLSTMGYWVYRQKEQFKANITLVSYGTLALLFVALITVIFARWVHHTHDVMYRVDALWNSIYFQTGISILWSMIAIVLMLFSKRYTNRLLWLAGFGLLITVVLKLFFVELASSGTIERIISFMVVGTLLLLIGYFVPLPPNDNKKAVV